MKRTVRNFIAFLPLLPLMASESHPHALWIVPAGGGYRIQYGEPGESLLEKKDKLAELGPLPIKGGSALSFIQK